MISQGFYIVFRHDKSKNIILQRVDNHILRVTRVCGQRWATSTLIGGYISITSSTTIFYKYLPQISSIIIKTLLFSLFLLLKDATNTTPLPSSLFQVLPHHHHSHKLQAHGWWPFWPQNTLLLLWKSIFTFSSTKSLKELKGSSHLWSLSNPWNLLPWEERKDKSCSWLPCFHSSKNIEVDSSNPRLFSSNLLCPMSCPNP